MKTKLLLAISLVVFAASPGWARAMDQSQFRPLPRDASGARPGTDYEPAGRASSQSFAHYWRVETVDSEGWVGQFTSLALDRSERPHISYIDFNNEITLKYVWHDGTSWNFETVFSSDASIGGVTSLALDGSDWPHISYFANLRLGYAWYDGADWHTEVVDGEMVTGSDNSLALDQAGRPHISYHNDYPPVGLKYAWHDGTGWNFEMVDSGDTGWFTSLALDGMGRPHISYHDNGYYTAGLKYAWYDGAEWRTETVDDSVGSVHASTSLVLDELNRPHISYYSDNSDSLKYAWHDGAEWHIETVDNAGASYIAGNSLELDGVGRPHIGYYGSSSKSLKYAWHDGTDWQIETVDSTGDVGQFVSLALDGEDQPYLSYFDDTNDDLKYAYPGPPPVLFLNKQARPDDGLRNNDVYTYTLTLAGSGLNVQLWDPLPEAVNYVAGSLSSSLEPTPVYSPASRAITWEGALPSSSFATLQFQVTPGITGTGSADLSQTIVNTAWLTDTEYGTSVSATAIVNGEHIYLPLVLRLR